MKELMIDEHLSNVERLNGRLLTRDDGLTHTSLLRRRVVAGQRCCWRRSRDRGRIGLFASAATADDDQRVLQNALAGQTHTGLANLTKSRRDRIVIDGRRRCSIDVVSGDGLRDLELVLVLLGLRRLGVVVVVVIRRVYVAAAPILLGRVRLGVGHLRGTTRRRSTPRRR